MASATMPSRKAGKRLAACGPSAAGLLRSSARHWRSAGMEYRSLGRSGLKVSPLCLGTMTFGGPTDAATSERIITLAHEAGINFIDTADQYNDGRSEDVVGRAIAKSRDAWVLASKLCNPMGIGPNERGLSRKWVMQAAEASLRRLGTDYLDIYSLHQEDHGTPLDGTVRAMGDLVRQGKSCYFGFSNPRSFPTPPISALPSLFRTPPPPS